MTVEIACVLVISAAVLTLFVTELVAIELVAVGAMVALMAVGILTPAEGLAGFSNDATIVVGSMFVLAEALNRSGALTPLASRFTLLLSTRPTLALLALIFGVAIPSAFVSNTPIVAAALPLVIASATAAGIAPSKLLIPLSFASIMGGTCTVIGTSTTLVVNDVARGLGQPSISMFEMLPLGAVFLAAGAVYLLATYRWLLPEHPTDPNQTQDFDFVSELRIVAGGPLDGARLSDVATLSERSEALTLFRRGQRAVPLRSWTRLRAHDVVRLVAERDVVQRIVGTEGLIPIEVPRLTATERRVAEVVITPFSRLANRSLKSLRFQQTFDARLLGIRQRPQFSTGRLHKVALHPGDVLLLEISDEGLSRLRHESLVVVSTGPTNTTVRRPLLVVGIIAGSIAAATMGFVALPTAALAAALGLILVGSLSTDEAYQAIEWRVVFLLASIMSLGVAMQKTGAADLLADLLIAGPGQWGPWVLLSVLYLSTSILTEFMSNVGTAVVLTPVAVAAAQHLGVDPRPLVMAIVFGASASFMSPVGYQTNLLVYGAGRYTFRDFLKIGVPLNLLFWGIATALIPRFWPF